MEQGKSQSRWACVKSSVFKFFLKTARDVAFLMLVGRSFHIRGADEVKDLEAVVVRQRCRTKVRFPEDRMYLKGMWF